jgi:hypothetical protein
MRKENPELLEEKSWILHQYSAPAYNAIAVKEFLADKCISLL